MINNMREKKIFRPIIMSLVAFLIFAQLITGVTYAETEQTGVLGKVYTLDEDSHYEFSDMKEFSLSDETKTYGDFFLGGNVADIGMKNGVPAYEVENGNLKLSYIYSDTLLKTKETAWHIINDKSKKIDGIKLDEKIQSGAIILQTSKDQKNWTTVKCNTDIFSKQPVNTEALYKTEDIEILNGCYYRLIVAYKMQKLQNTKELLFWDLDDYKDKKIAEVYEFYAYSASSDNSETLNQTYNLGEKVRAKNFDGYTGIDKIEKKDPHYGWDLGQFYVSGYTEEIITDKDDIVFLKNVGDKVTLWFNLEEDINRLNGDKDLAISVDSEGYDEYFETPRMNFGKGTLIIRHTDYQNNASDPQIYTNYLEANTSIGADTKVQLFEEGDYEVALDYEITNNKLIDKVGHYRIFFKFSVRNGNCMVYPFDVGTGGELTNGALTENGFMIDLAKSRYLNVNVKREVLVESADGIIKDTRYNAPAHDGEEYTKDGIYTITAINQYTNQKTQKKIYVGADNIMKAHVSTGLTIEEINKMLDEGAEISEDGIITLSEASSESEVTVREGEQSYAKQIVIGMIILICFVIILVMFRRRKNRQAILEETSAIVDSQHKGGEQ